MLPTRSSLAQLPEVGAEWGSLGLGGRRVAETAARG
jgi:hypothetical protein